MIVQVAIGHDVAQTEAQSLGDFQERQFITFAVLATVERPKLLKREDFNNSIEEINQYNPLLTSRFHNLWTMFWVAGRGAIFTTGLLLATPLPGVPLHLRRVLSSRGTLDWGPDPSSLSDSDEESPGLARKIIEHILSLLFSSSSALSVYSAAHTID